MPSAPSTLPRRSANELWVSCVKAVCVVCEARGKTSELSHSPISQVKAVCKNSRVLHGLYHFCTQHFPTYFFVNLPLFSGMFSTLSTAPINITTTYINK
jgi:hypothetical protein